MVYYILATPEGDSFETDILSMKVSFIFLNVLFKK